MVTVSISERSRGALHARMRSLQKTIDEFDRKVTVPVSETARSLVLLAIRKGQDPYGEDHPTPIFRPGGRPLSDRGLLRASITAHSMGNTAIVRIGQRYAGWLQSGTGLYGPAGRRIKPKTKRALSWESGGKRHTFRSVRGIRPRIMVPDKDLPLPPAWRAKIERAIVRALEESMK